MICLVWFGAGGRAMLCDWVETDLSRTYNEPGQIVEALATDERAGAWRSLGLKAVPLGIALAYQSLIVIQ
jgi:hypothetical protein